VPWSHRQVRPGHYVLVDEHGDSAELTMLPHVRNQLERVEQIVAAMNVVDEQLTATAPTTQHRSTLAALGWRNRRELDGRRRVVTARARALPVDVQAWLRRQWDAAGLSWATMTPDALTGWEQLVRSAPARFAQDRAAEQAAIDIAADDDTDWITTDALAATAPTTEWWAA
jgi:hypothetical protein